MCNSAHALALTSEAECFTIISIDGGGWIISVTAKLKHAHHAQQTQSHATLEIFIHSWK